MKRCPVCHQTYTEESMKFCRTDRTILESLETLPTEILTQRQIKDAEDGLDRITDANVHLGNVSHVFLSDSQFDVKNLLRKVEWVTRLELATFS